MRVRFPLSAPLKKEKMKKFFRIIDFALDIIHTLLGISLSLTFFYMFYLNIFEGYSYSYLYNEFFQPVALTLLFLIYLHPVFRTWVE